MAKVGRFSSKLRSVLKKINSISNSSSGRKQSHSHNLSRDSRSISSSSSSSSSLSVTSSSSSNDLMEQRRQQLQTVYVGMSRREYQVPTELLDHPVMRELATDDGSVIGCEVVLFDHLCWVLQQNEAAAAGSNHQFQPIDDLAAFYAY